MKNIRYLNYIIISACIAFPATQSAIGKGDDVLSPKSRIIKSSYELLNQDKDNIRQQLKYIQVFPRNSSDFKNIFAKRDFSGLYSGSHKYIIVLTKLAEDHPKEVGDVLISIGKDLAWEADAVGDLQHALARYAVDHTKTFAELVEKKLSKKEAAKLVRFIADVENFSSYEVYDRIISNLQKNGEKNLAQRFIIAREARKKKKTH